LKIEFDTNKYLDSLEDTGTYFHTFLNRNNIAAGILRLKPGEDDTQEPHDSDEVYYIVHGDGFLRIGQRDYKISQGMSYYVAKKVEHHFYGNKEKIVAVYFFSGPDT